MIVRLSKVLMVFLIGLYALFVAANNIFDYETNFVAVHHVLSMDTVLPTTRLAWRAVTSPPLQHVTYWIIIAIELLIGALCLAGAFKLMQARGTDARQFQAAKQLAVAGLVCGAVLWFFGFLTIAAEWFLMWQSDNWNVQDQAFRNFAGFALVLIFLNQRDEDLQAS